MANCPNCGVHLKKTYWKPNCPNCNVNIFYNGMQERLENDVITAGISLNKMYAMLDRAKASYIGSKLAIIRIIVSLIPIGALFLPLAKLSVNVPFVSESFSINALTLYNAVSTMDFEGLLGMFSSETLSLAVILFALSIVFIALGAVASLVGFIVLFLSCAPKGIQRNLGFAGIALSCYVLSGVAFLVSGSQFASVLGEGAYSASLSFGYFILLALAIAPIVINLLIKKNPIVVKSSAEKRKQEIAEKAAAMAAELEEAKRKEEEQRMIEEAYAAEMAKKKEEENK